MKRTIEVYGKDSGISIRVTAKIDTGDRQLDRDDTRHLAKKLARGIGEAMTFLPWTDFGADNVKVKV